MKAKAEQSEVVRRALATLQSSPAPKQEAPSPRPAQAGEKPDYRASYRKMTEAVPEDFPAVDAWLADHHPALWRRLRQVDNELTRLEQEGVSEGTYQQKLEELLDLCRAAKGFREGEWGAVLIRSEVLGVS